MTIKNNILKAIVNNHLYDDIVVIADECDKETLITLIKELWISRELETDNTRLLKELKSRL